MNVQTEIIQLKSQYRRARLAALTLCLFCGVGLIMGAGVIQAVDTVQAHEFVLLDAGGNRRGVLGFHPVTGQPVLALFDTAGEPIIEIVGDTTPGGGATVILHDSPNLPGRRGKVELHVPRTGDGHVVFRDRSGAAVVTYP